MSIDTSLFSPEQLFENYICEQLWSRKGVLNRYKDNAGNTFSLRTINHVSKPLTVHYKLASNSVPDSYLLWIASSVTSFVTCEKINLYRISLENVTSEVISALGIEQAGTFMTPSTKRAANGFIANHSHSCTNLKLFFESQSRDARKAQKIMLKMCKNIQPAAGIKSFEHKSLHRCRITHQYLDKNNAVLLKYEEKQIIISRSGVSRVLIHGHDAERSITREHILKGKVCQLTKHHFIKPEQMETVKFEDWTIQPKSKNI